MIYRVNIWKGVKEPYFTAHQLLGQEKVLGLWWKLALLFLVTCAISGLSAWLGIGNEPISKLIYQMEPAEFEALKLLFAIGQVLHMVLAITAFLLIPALVFWMFTELSFAKHVAIQVFAGAIVLLGQAIDLPFQYFWGLNSSSSLFSLGIIAQYITSNELVHAFFAQLNLFNVWVVYLQARYLLVMTERPPVQIWALVLVTNIFVWIFVALFSYIKFEILL